MKNHCNPSLYKNCDLLSMITKTIHAKPSDDLGCLLCLAVPNLAKLALNFMQLNTSNSNTYFPKGKIFPLRRKHLVMVMLLWAAVISGPYLF